jgi:hypothetical protein
MESRSGGFFIQNLPTPGNPGDFTVVVPAAAGGLMLYYLNNADPHQGWQLAEHFAADKGTFSGAALIRSSFGDLEVVGVAGGRLLHYYRTNSFQLGKDIAGGVVGAPGFIQNLPTPGNPGDCTVVVPADGGGLMLYYRDNKDSKQTWGLWPPDCPASSEKPDCPA